MSLDLPAAASLDVTDTSPGCGGGCACGQSAEKAPELDARLIPAAVRHAAILGALGGLSVGQQLVLLAPHEPVPLLAELDEREPGAFLVGYDQRGPETWRIRLMRAR